MNPQKSILIVDDDATIRDTFALCLEMADYQAVSSCGSGWRFPD